jgi:NAD(P)-dependent dehydrogenase (short-subunit alcohol dehydrogenase family)
MIDLSGRVALVTGGVRGVGAGITRQLLRAGADVVVCARHRPETPIVEDGRRAFFRAVDVRDPGPAQDLVAAVAADFGRLDLLVNNAGGAPYTDSASASPRFNSRVVDLNFLAPLAMSQAANAVMQDQTDGGSIIMVSSVSALRPSPRTASYGAAKAALNNVVGTLAVEWAPRVRLNSLAVGIVRTEQSHLHYGGEDGIARIEETIPLGRMAAPEDIGGVCVFLASPLASYVSGAVIPVHGGGEVPSYLVAMDNVGSAAEPVSVADTAADNGAGVDSVHPAGSAAQSVAEPSNPR